MPRILRILAPALLALLAAPLWAARPTIAVLPFSIERTVVVSDGHRLFAGTLDDQTALLGSELVHQLVASRKFDVLERERVDELLKEKDFTAGDYASPDEAAKLARLLGADYFVLGRIDDLGAHSEEKSIPYSHRRARQLQAHIALHLRIVDARSGRIVAAENFQRVTTLRDPKPADSIGRQLVADAAQAMVGRIVDTVFPLRVAQLDGNTLYLNRGRDGSLAPGDHLGIYRLGAAIVDQDSGEPLGHTETEVGQARVVAVEARFTRADLLQAAPVEAGMLVKKLPPPVDAATAAAGLPAGPRW